MKSSGAVWSIKDLERRVQGFQGYEYPKDKAEVIRFNEIWTPTGGIHSNAEDMTVFLAAQLIFIDTPLASAIEKSHSSITDISEGPPRSEMRIFWEILYNRDGDTIIKSR